MGKISVVGGGGKAANDEEVKEVDMMRGEVVQIEQTPLFYTQSSGLYLHNPQSKRLNDTSRVEQANQLWRNGTSLSHAIDNIDYDGPEEVNITQPGWTNLIPNVLTLPQEEHV